MGEEAYGKENWLWSPAEYDAWGFLESKMIILCYYFSSNFCLNAQTIPLMVASYSQLFIQFSWSV